MGYNSKLLSACKKIKADGQEPSKKKAPDIHGMSYIVSLINLSNEERKEKLVSKYVGIVSEFILYKAKKMSGEKEKISTNDIKMLLSRRACSSCLTSLASINNSVLRNLFLCDFCSFYFSSPFGVGCILFDQHYGVQHLVCSSASLASCIGILS